AVLVCDTPVSKVKIARGGYGDIFGQLLKNTAAAVGPEDLVSKLRITEWDIVTAQSYPEIEEVDAFLLTGSSK
ncbi:hypothetical protein I5L01_15620, partial [Erythrobacter sp. YJ-T3-07]|uniref:hypothetical protein n=1 Tax=Erythrobacter sp. YJ-T3-07 TaxID=2793063 RepID=UPI0018D37F08